MQGLSKHRALDELRARIEAIENRAPLAHADSDVRSHELLAAPPGLLHEVCTDFTRNAGAALGFALGMAKQHLSARRPVILAIQLAGDSHETGLPYGPGLAAWGLVPEALVLCRPETLPELCWAIEEAAACPAVAAIIADPGSRAGALDFTLSRRLGLRAVAGKVSIFLLRYGTGREASAARLRWWIGPAPSGACAFDDRAPGTARWRVRLEKGRLGPSPQPVNWMLDWTEENGFAPVDPRSAAARSRLPAGAAVPRAGPAALGDRLSEAG